MFSDRARTWKILAAVVALVWLGHQYTRFALSRPEGYRAALASPDEHDGADLLFPLWRVTHIRSSSVYEISKTIANVPVYGDAQSLSVGDTVTVKGHFRAKGAAVLAYERIDHPHRKTKGLLSIGALLFAAFAAPRFFGIRNRRVVLRG